MKAYSLDLSLDIRKKIVESVTKGVSKSQTAQRFGVDHVQHSSISVNGPMSAPLWPPSKRSGRRPKLDQRAMKLLEKELQEKPCGRYTFPEQGVPGCYLRSEGEEATVRRALKRLSYSRKKDPEQPQKETSS